MKTFLTSLLLATTLLVPSLVSGSRQKRAPVCKRGAIQIKGYMTRNELTHDFKNDRESKQALDEPKLLCQCEDVDEDTDYFVSTEGAKDKAWAKAVAKLGRTHLEDAIESWLDNDNSGADTCDAPVNGVAHCKSGKCTADCAKGFTPKVNARGKLKSCDCPLPKVIVDGECVAACLPTEERVDGDCQDCDPRRLCNGVCQKKFCPANPQPTKRMAARSFELRKGEAECSRREGGGWKLCRTASAHGQMGPDAGWSCMNILSGLESCGGCPFDAFAPLSSTHGLHPALQPLNADAIHDSLLLDQTGTATATAEDADVGRDCSSIAHADSVGCVQGTCVVEACVHGWSVTENGAACVQA